MATAIAAAPWIYAGFIALIFVGSLRRHIRHGGRYRRRK